MASLRTRKGTSTSTPLVTFWDNPPSRVVEGLFTTRLCFCLYITDDALTIPKKIASTREIKTQTRKAQLQGKKTNKRQYCHVCYVHFFRPCRACGGALFFFNGERSPASRPSPWAHVGRMRRKNARRETNSMTKRERSSIPYRSPSQMFVGRGTRVVGYSDETVGRCLFLTVETAILGAIRG